MLRIGSFKQNVLVAAIAVLLLPAATLSASTLIYTFSGTASGTISGNTNATFTNASFSVSFTENTSDITGGGGFFLYNPATGRIYRGRLQHDLYQCDHRDQWKWRYGLRCVRDGQSVQQHD